MCYSAIGKHDMVPVNGYEHVQYNTEKYIAVSFGVFLVAPTRRNGLLQNNFYSLMDVILRIRIIMSQLRFFGAGMPFKYPLWKIMEGEGAGT